MKVHHPWTLFHEATVKYTLVIHKISKSFHVAELYWNSANCLIKCGMHVVVALLYYRIHGAQTTMSDPVRKAKGIHQTNM